MLIYENTVSWFTLDMSEVIWGPYAGKLHVRFLEGLLRILIEKAR